MGEVTWGHECGKFHIVGFFGVVKGTSYCLFLFSAKRKEVYARFL